MIVGAILGAMLLSMIMSAAHTQVVWWMYLIGAVAGAVLASIFLKPFIILGSAFSGAYFAVTGAYSLILMKEMIFKEHIWLTGSSYPWYVFAAILLLTVLCAAVQFGLGKGHVRGIG